MTKKKQNFQEKILDFLSGRKAASRSEVVEELENDPEDTKTRYAVSRTIKRMAETGMVELHETEQSQFIRMTEQGRSKLNSLKLSSDTTLLPKTWDGRWRIVILDLPESRKSERDSLRYMLKKAYFVPIKNSVWVSPYPFEHFLANIKKDLDLSSELMIMVVDQLDDETQNALIEKLGMD